MNNKLNNNFSLRKLLLTALVAGPLATLPAPLWALPDVTSANLTSSAGVTTQINGTTLSITAPDKAILTWQAFGSGASTIGSSDIINYYLPTTATGASVLNTVTGGAATTIAGQIISNGNVYILNPSGIVLTPTARVSVGGFYASTVAEPSGFFSIEGKLSFAGTSTASIVVQGTGTNPGVDTAAIQAIGTGNNIYLAGNAVNVQGGIFYGNLFVKSSGSGAAANPLASAIPGTVGTADGAVAAGTFASFATTGPVSVNTVGSTAAGGGLNITTNGGNVSLTGAIGAIIPPATTPLPGNTLSVSPGVVASPAAQVSINTTGNGINGSIIQGTAAFIANTTGTVVTLNAGTGTTAGNIALANTDFLTVAASGNNIQINEATALVLGNVNAAGNFDIRTIGADLTSAGTVTVGGTIDARGRGVTLTGSGNLTFSNIASTSTLTVTTTGDLTLNNTVPAISNSRSIALTSTTGKLTVAPALTTSTLTLAAPQGTISVAGLLTTGTTAAATNGATSITANGDITLNTGVTGGITARNNSGGATSVTVTSTAGNISLGNVVSGTNLTATATAGNITAGTITSATMSLTASNGTVSTGATTMTNNLTINAGSISVGTISIGNNSLALTASTGSISTGNISTGTASSTLSAPSLSGSITTGSIVMGLTTAAFNISSGGSINLGNNNVANTITVPTLNVTSTGGSITQSAVITSVTRAVFSAAGDIQLTNTGNAFNNIALIGGQTASPSGFQVSDVDGLILGTGTNTVASVTILTGAAGGANGGIQFGGGITDSLNFGGNLTLTQGAGVTNLLANSITTVANSVGVFGNVSITTKNNNSATLGNNILGNAANYRFGQVSGDVGTGAFNIYENTTLNLGSLHGATLDARSFGGDIVNTGRLDFSGAATFSAGTNFSPNNVSLTSSNNTLANAIIGNAKDFTLVNSISTLVTAGSLAVNGKAATGTVSVTVTGSNANTLTLNTAPGTNGDFNIVSFSAPGAVSIIDPNGLTLQNATNTLANNNAAVNISAAGPIVLGSGINLGGNGVTTFTSTYAVNSPTPGITDSASGIRVFGEVQFVSDGNIAITNTGHSFGTVSLTTTGVATAKSAATAPATGTMGLQNITFTEGGTLVLKTVSVGGTPVVVPAVPVGTIYPGSLTLTSTGGSIIQAAGGTIVVPTVSGANTVSFTSATGSVVLDKLGNRIETALNLSAVGNSTYTQNQLSAGNSNVLYLGNITVTGGTLTIDTSGVVGEKIVQYAGTTIKSFGNPTFLTRDATVTLTNSGNNFGGVTINTVNGGTGADIAITETGTLNLVGINSGTGKFAATSEAASIIQSGSTGIVVGGATTLNAATGINLNTLTTNNTFGGNTGILITTAGNVSIQDASAVTALASGTNIGGTLSVKNSNVAGGEIKDLPGGSVTVAGNASFDTGLTYDPVTDIGARINLGSSTLSLGAITFRSGKVTIVENATLNMGSGSTAKGAVSLTSSGNIVTSGTGGNTFLNTLFLGANGNITISNPFFVSGSGLSGLSFHALGAVDLSILSLSGNLSNIPPTNLGAASYKAPSP